MGRHKNYIKQQKAEGLKVVYTRFQHANWTADSEVYKAYFVDYANKRFDIRFIDTAFFEYNDNILYCDISPEKGEPYKTAEERYNMCYLIIRGEIL